MRKAGIAIIAGAAALALAGCGRKDEAPPAPDTNVASADANASTIGNAAAPTFSPAQAFADSAAASDAFEIQSSQLALASASSAAVKAFARKMIDAHTQSTAKLKQVAAGLTPPVTPDPGLSAEQQAALDGLKGKTGKDFDTAYAAAQVDGHQKALDALKGYAVSGDQAPLQAFARDAVPVVTAHLDMAKALEP